MIDRRRCVILAVLLWSEAGRAQQADEFPIGAWFPGLFQADSTTDWADRLNLVVADSFNTVHASLTGIVDTSGIAAARNAGWLREAEARNLNIQLHSWWQPPQWRNHSRHYWARTFEVEEVGGFTSRDKPRHGGPQGIAPLQGEYAHIHDNATLGQRKLTVTSQKLFDSSLPWEETR